MFLEGLFKLIDRYGLAILVWFDGFMEKLNLQRKVMGRVKNENDVRLMSDSELDDRLQRFKRK